MATQEKFVPASELPDLVSAEEYVKSERYDISDKKFDLTDRVAIVTGACRGIGRAIARGFADYGAKVVVSCRKQEHLQVVSGQIKEAGGEVLAIAANYGKKEDVLKLVDEANKKFGRIDILVNNPVTAPIYGPFVETTTEKAWDKMMDVNLKGYYIASQAVAPVMKEQGKGNIINIATVGALHAEPGMGCYSINKAGVVMLTRVLAAELAKNGIRTNCICPGLINTFMSQPLIKSEEFMERFAKMIPMGRMGQPDEFVGISVFLASDASSYINGAIIPVDGGTVA
jgi:dehydrogenase/reductase SDR family member 4